MNERLRILVVEDNPADADLIRETLPETGPVSFRVESVSRLSDALARLKSKGIDLVLLDLGLPDSQGLQTFRKLQEAVPDVPVIVLTGTNDQELAFAAVRGGAQDYHVKGQIGGSLLARAAQYAVERQKLAAALREMNEHLEIRVKERTAELVQVNRALRAEIAERKQAEEALQKAHDELEQRVTERTEALRRQTEELRGRNQELTRFNRAAVGRELRMIELKQEVNELCRRLGEPPRHAVNLPPGSRVPSAAPDPAPPGGGGS